MKMPIEWHEGSLACLERYIRSEEELIKRLLEQIKRHKEEFDFYSSQIEYAKSLSKDGFDAEKFMKKRGQGNDKK